MPAAVKESDVTARDGRNLRVREAGDPNGFSIFVHHGTPMAGTLYEAWIDDAAGRGLRLLTHDRPGYGGSDRHEGRSVADVAADIADIADHLGMKRFATWGVSGGGPHSLACAALLGGRCTAAAMIAGVAPADADGLDFMAGMGEDNVHEFSLALNDHDALRKQLEKWRVEMLATGPGELFSALESLISEVDKPVLTGELAEFFHDADQIALAHGVDGWFDDDLAFAKPWGFDLAAIDAPVLLWQGRQDLMVPFAHGEWLAEHIPSCDARLVDQEGHLTLQVTRIADTHRWLLERSQ